MIALFASPGGMSTSAIVFMAASWILVLGLNLFCFLRVFRKR